MNDNTKIPETSPPVNRPTFYGDPVDLKFNLIKGNISNGLLFDEYDRDIHGKLSRISNNGKGLSGELELTSNGTIVFKGAIVHLQDANECRKLVADINGICPEAQPWDKIIDCLRDGALDAYRGIDEPLDASLKPENLYFPSMIDGLKLPVGLPSTIFAPGGKGKSLFAYYLCTLIQYGIVPDKLPFAPRTANVLYLDWESDIDVTRLYLNATREGLKIKDRQTIQYLPFSRSGRSIFDLQENISNTIQKFNIEFLVIDSQMAATAGGPQYQSEADKASYYYNVLQSFGITSLTIDHVTKASMQGFENNNSGAAYGSIVKFNRARSQYELRSQQDTESDHLEFALIHTKYNLGKKQNPIGIAIDFENVEGELRRMTFSQCDLSTNPALETSLPQYTRIKNAILDEGGKATPAKIAEITNIPGASVRMNLNNYKKIFTLLDKNEHIWGVLDVSG